MRSCRRAFRRLATTSPDARRRALFPPASYALRFRPCPPQIPAFTLTSLFPGPPLTTSEASRANCTVIRLPRRIVAPGSGDCSVAIPVPTKTGVSPIFRHSWVTSRTVFPRSCGAGIPSPSAISTVGAAAAGAECGIAGAGSSTAAAIGACTGSKSLTSAKLSSFSCAACARLARSVSAATGTSRGTSRYASTCCAIRLNTGAATCPPSCAPAGESSCT